MDLTRAAAAALDDADPLAGFRARFAGTDDDGPDRLLYLDGNSLGRLPRDDPGRAGPRGREQWGEGLVGSLGALDRRGRPGSATRWPPASLGARPGRGARRRLDVGQPLQAARRPASRRGPAATCSSCTADDFPTDRYVVAGVAEAPRA